MAVRLHGFPEMVSGAREVAMKIIFAQQPCGLPRTIRAENVRLVPVEPKVKSAKTCDLSNNHAGELAQIAKSADPTCYNSLTVDLTGLFDNGELA